MPITYLGEEHHALRYVPWARLRKDEDENVLGVLGTAFKLRNDEEALSVTWVEFFDGVHDARVASAIKAIRSSGMDVRPKSGFALGKVCDIRNTCLRHERPAKLRFIHDPEDDNEAHCSVRGWPRENEDLLELLAEDVWGQVILNKDVPA